MKILWKKYWNSSYGRFEHISDNELITIFKSNEGFQYKFNKSVMTKDFAGYATSIHYWNTLKDIKSYLTKNTHFMEVKSSAMKDYSYYEIIDNKITLQEI